MLMLPDALTPYRPLLLSLGFALALLPSAGAATNQPPARRHSNVDRLSLERLKAVHEDAVRLQSTRRVLGSIPGLTDFRCILHAHAEDSAHTAGTLPEMLEAAKKSDVNAILLADHFRPPRDFIDGRWRGMKDGVLFIPGSEVRGFLAHPMASILDKMKAPDPEFEKTVSAGDGLIFLSHIEERPEHPMDNLTGLEIYNRHWDAKKDMPSLIALAMKLTDPKSLAELEEAVRLYPDELLGFQCDYPLVYLQKWDASTVVKPLTGVAANDCHHNQVFLVKRVDENTVLVGTNVDKDDQMRTFASRVRPGIVQMTAGHKAGDVLARVDLDPYPRSFRNVATHVLAPRLDEAAIRTALKAGHAYVSHDWICDAKGFAFEAQARDGAVLGRMGDRVALKDAPRLQVRMPVPAHVRLMRQGEQVAVAEGKADVTFPVSAPGVYRVEAWETLDQELRPWIFSNPIYVQ